MPYLNTTPTLKVHSTLIKEQQNKQAVFITPECIITNKTFRNMLLSVPYQEKLVALVIDEAHCIKTWGDEFRQTFSEIGNLCSVIPTTVNVLVLTAIATTETFYVVRKGLSMDNPRLVALPPCRDNISYTVHSKTDVDKLTDWIIIELNDKRKTFPIYVRSSTDCSSIYVLLKRKLGPTFTKPPGCPNVTGYRIIDMLTEQKKDEVLQSFSAIDGVLRLVIATTAFGMGIDCPDIRRIVHWGIPSTMEEYVQEAGRCGRDGNPSTAILYEGKGGKHADKK